MVPSGTIRVGALFVNGTEKAVPLQVIAVWLGINGFGLTVTVRSKVFVQKLGLVPEEAVTL